VKRIVLLLALSCGVVALPVMLTEQALRMPSERRNEPDKSKALDIAGVTGTRWSEAEITTPDGAKLKGWTFLPPPEHDSGKAIILLHGAGDSRKGMLGFSRFFAQRGYATLVVDSRGHGISGGPQVTYGLLEKQDVHRWADYLLGVKPNAKLYGLGMSMGAAILIQSLESEARFRSIVAECSYSTFRAAASERIPRLTGLPAAFSTPIVSAAFFYAKMRYGHDLESISPVESLKHSRTPVLLIHGLDDGRTAPEQSRTLHAANLQTTELWEVPGAKHVQASVVAQKEFEDRVLRWFEK
jgi:dipeptidyl aminopeptidase/acylaminoacyl peptidase